MKLEICRTHSNQAFRMLQMMSLDSDRLKLWSLVRVRRRTDGLGSKGLQVPKISCMLHRMVLRAHIRTGINRLRFRGTSDQVISSMKCLCRR